MSTFPGFNKPLHKYKVVELKSFLRERGLKVSGLKRQLINRLTIAIALEEENKSDNNSEYDSDNNQSHNNLSDYLSQHNNKTDNNSDSDIEIIIDNYNNKNHTKPSKTKQITHQNNSHNINNNLHTNHIQSFQYNNNTNSHSQSTMISPPNMQHNTPQNLQSNGYQNHHHNAYNPNSIPSYNPYHPPNQQSMLYPQNTTYCHNGNNNNNSYPNQAQYKPDITFSKPNEYITNRENLRQGNECKIYSRICSKWFIGTIIHIHFDQNNGREYLLVEYDNKRRQLYVYKYSNDIKSVSIFDKPYPQSTLANSHFLQLYDFANRNNIPITVQTIRNCLSKDLQIKLDYDMRGVWDIKQICIWLWSLGSMSSGLFKDFNISLYKDDREQIKRFLPIIRGLNRYLVREIKQQMITWRGSKMTMEHFEMFKENHRYRCPAIGATSLDYYEAKKFKHKYMIQFIIPIGAWNAAEITHYSQYKKEKEVLFPPYTAFEVLKINRHCDMITVKVLDNKKVSLNVPSVFI